MIKPANIPLRIVVLISADQEWSAVKKFLHPIQLETSPYGEWFMQKIQVNGRENQITYFQSGWGKTKAAGSTQFAVDHFHPDVLINLGTCGGFSGCVQVDDILLVEKTIIYDIYEQMIEPELAISAYSTQLDLSFLLKPFPQPVIQTLIVSADRDLMPEQIAELKSRYQAIAGDWESGSIAFIAHANQVPCLILRGVSDIVSADDGGEAYQNLELFTSRTRPIMERFITALPAWLGQMSFNRPG